MTEPKITVAERLLTLFAGSAAGHGTHGVPTQNGLKWEIKTTAQTVRGPATLELWEAHLRGTAPLGVVPVREDSTCSWASIDVDQYDVDLIDIIRRVVDAALPLIPCRSKSGGLHLFLFLAEAVPAGVVQDVMKKLAARLGLAKSEIFPKQAEVLTERGDVGNWIVMPYYGDTYGGKIREQLGLKKNGTEMTLPEFLRAAEGARLVPERFDALRAEVNLVVPVVAENRKRGATAKGREPSQPFADGPVCLQHLVSGGKMGDGRKRTLFMMGLYYKRADPANWKTRTEAANALFFAPALPSEEVTTVVRSLGKKDYEYTCREEPMCSHCDARLCATRRVGVGGGGHYPAIAGLSKLDTDPPVWFLDVGDRRYEASTDQLLNYARMMILFAERGNKVYRPMKQVDWIESLRQPMDDAVIIAAPADAGRAGQLFEILEDFLVNKWRGEVRGDLLRAKPWEDVEAQRHYFRLQDLQKILVREGLRDLTRGQIVTAIQRLGGGHHQFNIDGKNVYVWWVPSDVAQAIPTLAVTPPPRDPI